PVATALVRAIFRSMELSPTRHVGTQLQPEIGGGFVARSFGYASAIAASRAPVCSRARAEENEAFCAPRSASRENWIGGCDVKPMPSPASIGPLRKAARAACQNSAR